VVFGEIIGYFNEKNKARPFRVSLEEFIRMENGNTSPHPAASPPPSPQGEG
jgi:hypothetical protein